MSALNKIVSGEATFGKIIATITAILTTIFSIVIFPYLYTEIFGTWKQTVGEIINSPNCTFIKDNFNYNCSPIEVKFTVDEKEYRFKDQIGLLDKEKYVKNAKIPVWYQSVNPALFNSLTNKIPIQNGKLGLILISIVLVFVWAWVWITYNFKPAAVLGGISGTISLLG